MQIDRQIGRPTLQLHFDPSVDLLKTERAAKKVDLGFNVLPCFFQWWSLQLLLTHTHTINFLAPQKSSCSLNVRHTNDQRNFSSQLLLTPHSVSSVTHPPGLSIYATPFLQSPRAQGGCKGIKRVWTRRVKWGRKKVTMEFHSGSFGKLCQVWHNESNRESISTCSIQGTVAATSQ